MTHATALAHAGVAVALVLSAEQASAQTPPGESRPAPARPETAESAGSVAERVVAEFMVGSGFATVGFLAGSKLVSAACATCVYAAGFAGASATFPVGVYAGGRLVRGKGNFLLTVAAPWIISATTVVALARDEDYDGRPAFEIGTIGGAVAAPLSMVLFELSHAWVSAHSTQRARGAARFQAGVLQSRSGFTLFIARDF